jgi:DNA-binding LytR/AlgR family response regulator
MIRAIAIDDEPPALKVIENFCAQLEYLRLENTFIKPGEALHYLAQSPVDLLFLDINMPALNGIDFYKSIGSNTMAIFTTAYSEYAVEGFNLQAIDYLLKPFPFQRFQQATDKALEYFNFRQQKENGSLEHIFVKVDYSLLRITISDILFIEGLDDYLRIHLQGKPPLLVRMTMKTIIAQLPSRQFMRVHRSYIVPLNRIENIRNKTIYLADQEIPIGISYEKEVYRRFPK